MPIRARRRPSAALLGLLVAATLTGALLAPDRLAPAVTTGHADDVDRVVRDAVKKGTELLLATPEKDGAWTYRGVYGIPVGYRVGGTSIVGLALLQTGDRVDRRKNAKVLERATLFVIDGLSDPLMDGTFKDTYDVRVWGQTYALQYLCALRAKNPSWSRKHGKKIDAAITFAAEALIATEIPERGGWNYSRPRGGKAPNAHGSFVTAPVVQALLEARARGIDVPDAVLERAAVALERSRNAETGAFTYSGAASGRAGRTDKVPGAIARMPISDATLLLLGEGSRERTRASVDAFFEHWNELEKRRAKNGTHEGPYGIAPYYFFYGQYYAAQAIEQLEEADRPERRAKLRDLLLGIRNGEDGSWNDRVFEVSRAYGTAMAILALTAKDLPEPASRASAKPAKKRPRRGRVY